MRDRHADATWCGAAGILVVAIVVYLVSCL